MKVTLIAMGVVLAASASSALSQTHYCPDTGHWYEAVVVPSRLGWSAASSAAQLRGGYLASIQSSQENTFVFGLVDSADFWYSPSPASQWGPWLGGYQLPGSLEPDGGWRWVDGTAFTYTNWHSHAPNNSASGIPEETLHFYSTTTQPESWWNDMPDAASDWTVPGYVVEYATATPAQACYLDFSGYTAPAGYGSAEQIAADVKASVASKFTQQNLTFMTSFEGASPDPSVTSSILFGGTDPSPTRLGAAAYDPGNANRSDTGYVYTGQSLFSSMPTNGTEYRNMLGNVTAHEVGHLLGYSHADAAGMPYMLSGDAMEARIRQDLLLGELGQITQQRYTYVVDADFDMTVYPVNIVYINQGTRTQAQYEAEMAEFNQFLDDQGLTVAEYAEFAVCTFSDVNLLLTLGAGKIPTLGLDSVACFALQVYNDPDRPAYEYLPLTTAPLFLFGDDDLDVGAQTYTVEPVWNEDHQAWLYFLDGVPMEFLEGASLSFYLGYGEEGSDTLRISVLDDDLNLLNEHYMVAANVPEPATLSLLTAGAAFLLRRRRP